MSKFDTLFKQILGEEYVPDHMSYKDTDNTWALVIKRPKDGVMNNDDNVIYYTLTPKKQMSAKNREMFDNLQRGKMWTDKQYGVKEYQDVQWTDDKVVKFYTGSKQALLDELEDQKNIYLSHRPDIKFIEAVNL